MTMSPNNDDYLERLAEARKCLPEAQAKASRALFEWDSVEEINFSKKAQEIEASIKKSTEDLIALIAVNDQTRVTSTMMDRIMRRHVSLYQKYLALATHVSTVSEYSRVVPFTSAVLDAMIPLKKAGEQINLIQLGVSEDELAERIESN
jgi:hypothetical protein